MQVSAENSCLLYTSDMSKLTDINTIAITYYCENISNDSVEIKGNHDSVRLNVEDKMCIRDRK